MKFALLLFISTTFLFQNNDNCGIFRNKKRNDNLFQNVQVLKLNCDGTFSFRRSNCINPDTSFGTWTQIKDSIFLSTSKKLKRLVKRETKTVSGHAFVDFDNQSLKVIDSFVVWKRPENFWTDTLFKQWDCAQHWVCCHAGRRINPDRSVRYSTAVPADVILSAFVLNFNISNFIGL